MNALRMLIRGLTRNRRRTLLTFLGLVVSFFVYTALSSVLYTLTDVIARAGSATTLFVRPRFGVRFWRAEIPLSYLPKIRAIPGAVAVTPYDFFLGKGKKEGDYNVAIGVDPVAIQQVRELEGVTPAELAAFRTERSAALIGQRMLESNHWKVPNEVTLEDPMRGRSLTIEGRGDLDREDDFGDVALMSNDYLQDANGRTGKTVFVIVKAARPDLGVTVARAIDQQFKNFSVPTETISEKAFTETVIGGLADTLRALTAIGYLTLAVTVLVVSNTVAMSVRERTTEIGTLRALGFSSRRVLGLVLGEAALVATLGGVGGALLGWAVFHFEWIKLPEEVGLDIKTSWQVIAKASLWAVPIGALAGLKPAWDASRMPITEALRHAD